MPDVSQIMVRLRDMVDGVKPNPEWPSDIRALLDEVKRHEREYLELREAHDQKAARAEAAEAELARLRVDLETVTLQRDSMRMEAERAGAELARLREPVGDVGEVMRRLQAGICDDKCKIMNVSGGCDCAIAAELLLRQAGEIEEAQRRYDGVYAQWGLAAKLCDEHRTRAETAEARGYAAAREQAEDAISELIVADARTDYERALDDAILALQEERDNAEQAARVEANERRRLQSRLGKAVEALRRIDAMDWGWKGGGSEVRVPGKYAQVARSVLSELEKSE